MLIKNTGSELVYDILRWSTKGFLNLVISGDQNSGKTTCLKALGIFFDRREPIRTTEPEFEMWLNNAYDFLNCLCFRPSGKVSIAEAIDIQKKTDATRMILGEVNSYTLAIPFISLCQVGSKATMCTGHWSTSEDMVDYFRNAIMSSGTFHNEMIAEEQVANSIHLDIHWEKTPEGQRYIKYINEIVPLPREEERKMDSLESIAQSLRLMSRKRAFFVREIIFFEDGEYILKNNFSERCLQRIFKNLSESDRAEFTSFCESISKKVA
jgi:pilus assembly protein CpaF